MKNPSSSKPRPREFVVAGCMVLACVSLLLMSGQAGVAAPLKARVQAVDPSPPSEAVKLAFIHHSCGSNWLADGNGGLGIELRDNNYFVSDTNYGWGPDSIGNNTDIGHWWTWFRGPSSNTYLSALYAESSQHSSYSRLVTDPGGENQIIMFKSCYPNSNLKGNPTDPPTTDPNPLRGQSCGSSHHTVANAKGIYNDILEYFETRQDKLFVVITAPPVQSGTYADNARAFNTWLVEDWLDGYPYNNVAVFDFYNVLTSNGGNWYTNDFDWETGNHHRYRNSAIEYATDQGGNVAAYPNGGSDNHPSAAGNQKATGEFIPLLNIFYHRWESSQSSATYYVRPDGGSPEECTGLANAPYPGGGTGQPCAWDHPFRALPPDGAPRIAGGDTLIIGSGSYRMGYGAPGADNCSEYWPWGCHMPPLPSGPDSEHPTRILGEGWDTGCSDPPELWGAERPWFIVNLTDSSNVEVACLEITDHSGCVEFHSGSLACKRDNYPFGPWAAVGLYAEDSANVHLQDLNIHGLAHGGVWAGRLTDWTVEDVRIAGNGWVGWDGDLGPGIDSSNSGTLLFRRWTVEWNGCGETYPGSEPTGCWGQTAGGYGDGVGTGTTGGHWIIEDSAIRHNTSDGLDLLYVREVGSSITIRRTIAEGNAGNQIKTSGPVTIENSILIGNCGFFDGQPFTYDVDNCRALGTALPLFLRPGNQATLVNNTLTSEGDCLLTAECDDGCDGSESVLMRNNIFQGHTDFLQPYENTCLTWTGGFPHDPFDMDYSIINDAKNDPCPGAHDICGVSPGLVNPAIDDFDAHLIPDSPAIDAGSNADAPADDFHSNPRPLDGDSDEVAIADIGAHEFTFAGDLDHDCDVDIADVMLVASLWHTAVGDDDYDPACDLNQDGEIDIVDIMLVATHWGESCETTVDKWSLWTDGTSLRGANIWQRRVYPELDGTTFLGHGPVGPPFTQSDFDNLAALGANYVNISHPGLFTEDPPYALDQDIQDNLDNLLSMIEQAASLTEAGLFAVISARTGPGRSDFTFYWDGAGDWFNESYLNDSMWQDQDAQDAWVAMWAYTAQRYKDNPIVVGYDLMVEPNSNEVGSHALYDALDIWDPEEFYDTYGGTLYDWNQLYPRISTAIRQVDADTPILIGGNGYSAVEWLPYLQPTGDPRTVYTVHQYEPFVYTHQEPPLTKTYPGVFDTNWDGVDDQFNQAWLDNLLSTVDTFKTTHGAPVSVNEFGVMRWEPGADSFMDDEMTLFEQRGMNHALWVWDPAWEPWTTEEDAFNFRHGSDPSHHTDVESSDLMDVIVEHWGRNTIWP